MMTPASLIERARYLTTLFGRGGGRWHYSPGTLRSYESGEIEINDYVREQLAAEVPVAVVSADLDPPRAPSKADGCQGRGFYAFYDSDYDCSGCAGCRTADATIGFAISCLIWTMATVAERARLARTVDAMFALSQIGRAVAAALSPGLGVGRFLAATVQEWRHVRKGRWYVVDSKRGNAKEYYGTEGEAVWLGKQEFRGNTSLRVGLRVGPGPLVYVSANALAPMATPAEAAVVKRAEEADKAERAKRPAFAGARGDVGYVIAGDSAGKNGVVFWLGNRRGGGAGVGLRIGPGREDVAWCDACDVVADLVGATVEIAGPLTEAERMLVAECLADDDARIVLGDSIEARGFPGLAAAWRGPVPVATPAPVRAPGSSSRPRRRRAA